MKSTKSILILLLINSFHFLSFSQILGIENLSRYKKVLENKNIGLVVNHASQIENTHLVDTLLELEINISVIFSPEHGFSGAFNAGEYVKDTHYKDSIPIISLYGAYKKPSVDHLENIDIIVFDIQDVGVRFYTYLSTLHYVMEACAEQGVTLLLLDRPNPHTDYVDGPVLELTYSSFVGLHPVPIIYGMTIGEYALMINGERWLRGEQTCSLKIIKMESYSRSDMIDFKFPPSPNLPTMHSVLLYPSLCLFEGTLISVGRGTDYPFEVYGAPFLNSAFSFYPEPNFGSKEPKYNGQLCYGVDLRQNVNQYYDKINLEFLINAYNSSSSDYKNIFFNNFFNKLAGNDELQWQILNNLGEDKIRESWVNDIDSFLLIREKYLLYD
tara:strand:+ start:7772 stop:8923 length:1152 start_codon:yes stop_codon:yes gene_type:complete